MNCCSFARSAFDPELGRDVVGPLVHPSYPEPRRIARNGEAHAVVFDDHLKARSTINERYGKLRALSMPYHVSDCFITDSKEGVGNAQWNVLDVSKGLQLDFD